jgi:hypothetical protein
LNFPREAWLSSLSVVRLVFQVPLPAGESLRGDDLFFEALEHERFLSETEQAAMYKGMRWFGQSSSDDAPRSCNCRKFKGFARPLERS